jgi:hypothetical protein
MSEKFTQGEWAIEDRREESGSEYDYSIIAGDWYVANIVYNGMEEQEANAALIAAAPEMYWMLEELNGDLNALAINPNVSAQVKASAWLDVKHIERVLKKARGEE